MTKQDLVDWKRHPVTQQVFSQLQERVEAAKNELVGMAVDSDPRQLAFRSGAINAYIDLLTIEFEEPQLEY